MPFIIISSIDDLSSKLSANKSINILYFFAPWSPQCQDYNIALNEYCKNDHNLTIYQLEIEKFPELMVKYKIIMVPTVLYFQNAALVDRLEGYDMLKLNQKIKYFTLSKSISGPDTVTNNLDEKLHQLITRAPYMLFIKGSPSNPQCGFSNQIVEILKKHVVQFDYFDILSDPEIREGLKKYSHWPTFPQLYKNGELIGGLDIVKELESNGELDDLFNTKIIVEPSQSPMLLNERLQELVNKAPVMVFMKGQPNNPMCKFSKALIPMLNETKIPYETFDILEDEEVREGLKIFSNWPTYPQIYVKGELIGGVDIIKELREAGELALTLKTEKRN